MLEHAFAGLLPLAGLEMIVLMIFSDIFSDYIILLDLPKFMHCV